MSEADTQQRSPKILLISSGASWESDASQIAHEAGIEWQSIASVDDFFQLEGGDHHDTCLFIDARNPGIQWKQLHEGMLEKRIEIPVVIVAPQGGSVDSFEDAIHCANFVVTHPIERSVLVETVDFAFHNERFVRHRFAVERSYQRLVTLNERERSILTMAVGGAPNKQIARKMDVHIKTVERIRNIAYNKLKVRSTAEMTRLMTLAELYEFIRPSEPPTNSAFVWYSHGPKTNPVPAPTFGTISTPSQTPESC